MKTIFSRSAFLFVFFILLGGGTVFLHAQGQFILSGEIRERGVFSHGYKTLMGPNDHAAFFVGQRTRLNLDYKNDNLGFFIQLEDGRIWGETNGAHSPGFGIGQAYFYMDFAPRFGFKAGRMALQYENGRYLSYSSWDECPKTHDALIFNFRSLDKKTKADIGASFSNNSANTILNPYRMNNYFKYLLFAYASHRFTPDVRWSVLSVTDFQERNYTIRNQANTEDSITEIDPSSFYARSTVGTYLELFSERDVSALIYAYGQFGKEKDGTKVSSVLASAEIKYKLLPVLDIKVAYDFISGNDLLGKASPNHSFHKFLGSTHSFLGIMDYFSSTGTDDVNLGTGYHQPCIALYYRPAKNHSLELNARYFWTVKPIIQERIPDDPSQPGFTSLTDVGKNLGLEMALIYKYKIHPDLDLEAGYAIHTPTRTLELLNGITPGTGKFAHFGYVMLSYKPVLFNSANHPKK